MKSSVPLQIPIWGILVVYGVSCRGQQSALRSRKVMDQSHRRRMCKGSPKLKPVRPMSVEEKHIAFSIKGGQAASMMVSVCTAIRKLHLPSQRWSPKLMPRQSLRLHPFRRSPLWLPLLQLCVLLQHVHRQLDDLNGLQTLALAGIWCLMKLCRNKDITARSFPSLP